MGFSPYRFLVEKNPLLPAILIVGIAMWLGISRFGIFEISITILNQTSTPIQQIKVQCGGKVSYLKPLAAGAQIQRTVHISDGTLHYTIVQNGAVKTGAWPGSLDDDCVGESYTLLINQNGVEAR